MPVTWGHRDYASLRRSTSIRMEVMAWSTRDLGGDGHHGGGMHRSAHA